MISNFFWWLLRQDNEYNSFQIDLQNPAQPTVVLAGEVAGLKPKAVASNPVEPLLFVVDRKFEAMELVGAVLFTVCCHGNGGVVVH